MKAFLLGMLAGLVVAGIYQQKPALPQPSQPFLPQDPRRTTDGLWLH
jgi:hypothetical protein